MPLSYSLPKTAVTVVVIVFIVVFERLSRT
jgi:hypothetical protein